MYGKRFQEIDARLKAIEAELARRLKKPAGKAPQKVKKKNP